jgi:hypothetical protein
MLWLEKEVSPVITALAELAVGEAAQLTQDIAAVSEEMAMYKETITKMAKAKFAPAGSLVSGAMDNVARLESIHRRFTCRLELIKMADTVFRSLELGQLREQLGLTKAVYEAEVLRPRLSVISDRLLGLGAMHNVDTGALHGLPVSASLWLLRSRRICSCVSVHGLRFPLLVMALCLDGSCAIQVAR